MDLCVAAQLSSESFYVPAHRTVYDTIRVMYNENKVVDVLTVTERLDTANQLEAAGGPTALDRLIDSTPTAAHAEYYIDIVRQKHLLRLIIDSVRSAEQECHSSIESADQVLSRCEQSILEITERQHGSMAPWPDAIKGTMQHIERILDSHRGLRGVSTGYLNLDNMVQGMREGEMIVLAARPSMGKTSLAMNIVEHVALGKNDPDHEAYPVGVFSLEMSQEALVMRMLCSHAQVRGFDLARGALSSGPTFDKLTTAASVLMKAPIYLDDTGGLDILELRARARRMRKRHDVKLIVVDYLQLLNSKEYSRQGRQVETANVSGNLKAMAKELKVPVLVLSQLSRAPDQRDKTGVPKLSDLRDSGAIEQDADVVWLLRRPCKYDADTERDDESLAIVDVAKHRNGPTGLVRLNFLEEFTRFTDRENRSDDGGSVESYTTGGDPG
jgi:replicative DNA helicase